MIPEGTTSRQLAAIARWTMAIVLMAGALTWWWPSARSWGAMTGGLLIVFVLWLIWKTNRGDRSAPAGLFHAALAGPAAIWVLHFLRHGLLPGFEFHPGDQGTMDISELFQLFLLALAAMLAQDLFSPGRWRDLAVLLCAAAMVVGALTASLWGRQRPIQQSMNLLAFAGVSLWFSVLYSRAQRPPAAAAEGGGRPRPFRVTALGGNAVLFAALCALFPVEGGLAGFTLMGILLLVGTLMLACRSHRVFEGRSLILVPCLILVGAVAWLLAHHPITLDAALAPFRAGLSAFGGGEEAFARLTGTTTGVEFLGHAIGWVGLAWLGVGLLAAASVALWRSRENGEAAATVFRLWAAGLALAACLAPNGAFDPAVTLAVGFTWGLLHASVPRAAGRLSGWVLLGLLAGLMGLLGVAKDEGLAGWAGKAFGLDSTFLHVACGFLVAFVVAWRLGGGKVWKGLLGIGIAIAAGGAGELSQLLTTSRNARVGDFLLTTVGCCAAAIPYLLSMGARMCEEPPAP